MAQTQVTKEAQSQSKQVNTQLVLFLGVGSLLLAYGFGSWAIDSAHYWQYLLAIIFLVQGIKSLILSLRRDLRSREDHSL